MRLPYEASDARPLVGRVDPGGFAVQVYRFRASGRRVRNGFRPVLDGRVTRAGGGARVEVEMRSHALVQALGASWILPSLLALPFLCAGAISEARVAAWEEASSWDRARSAPRSSGRALSRRPAAPSIRVRLSEPPSSTT